MPRYVTIDLFGKVQVGKTTIFQHFVDPQLRLLHQGGNLSHDFRTYYARVWIFPNRWEHSMVFLADPKWDMRWQQVDIKYLSKMFEPTNILLIVTDSTEEDVDHIRNYLELLPRIKRGLIVFVIANMQDLPNRLSIDAIKTRLQTEDVIGLVATAPNTKEVLLPFLEKAVFRYFLMLSKLGEEMDFLLEKQDHTKENEPQNGEKKTRFQKHRERIKDSAKKEGSLEEKGP